MVRNSVTRKTNPLCPDRQNSQSLSFAAVAVLVLVLLGCHSAPIVEPVAAPPRAAVNPPVPAAPLPKPPAALAGMTTLTAVGENSDGQYSPDGKKILFLSRSRPAHAQTQVYEKDLGSGRERRVTFQDGDTSSPRYDPHGAKLYYASTTDELKENPLFLQKQFVQVTATREPGSAMPSPTPLSSASPVGQPNGRPTAPAPASIINPPWDLMPTDIYVSGLDGDNIQRLTNMRGFDGAITINPKTGTPYFSSYRTNHLQIYWIDLHTRLTHIFSREPLANQIELAISRDGQNFAWVQYAADYKSSQIVIGNTRGEILKTVTQGNFLHLSPAWAPNGEDLVFTSNREGDFDVYANNKHGTCLKRLTKGPALASHPVISPDGQQLLLASTASGSSQLYAMAYQPPAACADAALPAK
jgi:hypothetical protein